jgi:hypothetical protein
LARTTSKGYAGAVPMSEGIRWRLLAFLPNLTFRADSPFVSDHLCICSTRDQRLHSLTLTAADRTAALMARSFETWFGAHYAPSCLLVREDAPKVCLNADVLRAFRNVCALATITYSTARLLTGGQWLPAWGDFFLFASHVPNRDGSIGNTDGPVRGWEDDAQKFRGRCAGQIDAPEGFAVDCDRVLLPRLLKAWHGYHLARPREIRLLPLFRSLEVAFQASRFPSDGFSSINDIGTRIGLWVSAFEVLFHPQTGSVNKRIVQLALTRTRPNDARLRRNLYRCTWGRPQQTFRIAFPALVYDELYRARNAFMHGNPVTARDLLFRQSRRYPPLLVLAPMIYNVALRAYIGATYPPLDDERLDEHWFGLGTIEEALIAVRSGSATTRRRRRPRRPVP